jgi:solute carrier family 10 (sodium/bile acid cotransporter), member 7
MPAEQQQPDAEKQVDAVKAAPAWKRGVAAVWKTLVEYWFIVGVGLAIGLAAALPDLGKKGGWIRSEYSVKYGAVIVIFLLTGISLKTKVLVSAFSSLKTHLVIQAISFGVTPAIGFGLAKLLSLSPLNSLLIDGIIICASMPTTVSTNVVFTKAAGGNEAVAVVNSVIGNVLGVFLSPALLLLYLGRSSSAPYSKVFQDLGITVIAPLIVGQILQFLLPEPMKKLQQRVKFGVVSSFCILLLVWSTFCSTFSKDLSLDAGSVVSVVFFVQFMFLGFAALSFFLAWVAPLRKLWGFDRADTVAVVNCASTKTVALGIPLINVLYGHTSNAGILTIPLLVYHATQILVGGLLISHLKAWRDRDEDAHAAAGAGAVAEQQVEVKVEQPKAPPQAGAPAAAPPPEASRDHVDQQ